MTSAKFQIFYTISAKGETGMTHLVVLLHHVQFLFKPTQIVAALVSTFSCVRRLPALDGAAAVAGPFQVIHNSGVDSSNSVSPLQTENTFFIFHTTYIYLVFTQTYHDPCTQDPHTDSKEEFKIHNCFIKVSLIEDLKAFIFNYIYQILYFHARYILPSNQMY